MTKMLLKLDMPTLNYFAFKLLKDAGTTKPAMGYCTIRKLSTVSTK